jgi:beta-galactosidase
MKQIDFNSGWKFRKEGSDNISEVTLPHDAMILEKRGKDNPSGTAGAYYEGGKYVYTKTFKAKDYLPQRCDGNRVLIEFEGVFNKTFVYLNDCFVCANNNGYRGFFADITPFIDYESENRLEVKADNHLQPNCRWYTGSGIIRPVRLYVGGSIHIRENGLRITTPIASKTASRIGVETQLSYSGSFSLTIYAKATIRNPEGKAVCSETTPHTLQPNKDTVIYRRLYIQDAKLWNIDSPNLYSCEITLLRDSRTVDTAFSKFGIRRIEIDPVSGMRINGESILLRGACIHHDNGVIGAAEFDVAAKRRVQLLKKAGFNAIRTAHNPASKALLKACDEEGMLVLEESFDMWNHGKTPYDYADSFHNSWESDVEHIVQKDFNHPSVFMYCIGNEIPELHRPDGIITSRRICEKFRVFDPARFITNAVNGQQSITQETIPILMDMGLISKEQVDAIMGDENTGAEAVMGAVAKAVATGDINDVMSAILSALGENKAIEHETVALKLEEIFSHLDVCGYNYMLKRVGIDSVKYPNRIFLSTESNPPDIDLIMAECKTYPQFIGDFTWTGWDYIGEAGIGVTQYDCAGSFNAPYPCYLAYCGDIDITGYRRPASYYREIVYGLRKEPYISVRHPKNNGKRPVNTPWSTPETIESWTFPGYEGQKVNALVYSAGDEAELVQNGISLQKKPVGATNRYKAEFDVEYRPGTLEVISYKNGVEIGRFALSTAGEAENLMLKYDRENLNSNGSDVAFLEVLLEDNSGIIKPDCDKRVFVKVTGAGYLLGLGSANPYSTENFFDSVCTLYNGRALAAIRANAKGEIKVSVSGEDLKSKTIIINAI